VAAQPGRDVLLCPHEKKAELEARNAVEQLDYIAYLVNGLHIREIRESHIRELHSLCVREIYPCGGQYRNAVMRVRIEGSKHKIPHESRVPALIWDLVETINHPPRAWDYMDPAAHALWCLNWIHPFAGGNGRTARALAYLVVCVHFESTFPGVPSMPAIIAQRRNDYMRCLRAADQSATGHGANVSQMSIFLMDAFIEQLESALRSRAAARIRPRRK
jgi:Fic family protein